MSKCEMIFDFYNPRNPKCRSCTWYNGEPFGGCGVCVDKHITPRRSKYRDHNSKACGNHSLRTTFGEQQNRCLNSEGLLIKEDTTETGTRMCTFNDDIIECRSENCPLNVDNPPPELFYLENRKRGEVGNCLQFWKANDRGYTCDVAEAKAFTLAEAEKTIKSSTKGKYRMWCTKYIDERAVRHVDMQNVEPDQCRKVVSDE